MFRVVKEFDLYEIDENKVIRHRETGNIKKPHRGTGSVRLYKDGKEYTRKIDKLFDEAFPELVPGVILHPYSNYRVTKEGKVYSMHEAKFLVPARNKKGYLMVSLLDSVSGVYKSELVHRLVAKTYLGFSDLDVNHIDGNKSNNDVSNLEWVTKSENSNHAVATGLYAPKMRVCKLVKDGHVMEFSSIKDAADFIGSSPGTLRITMLRNYYGEVNNRSATGKFTCKGYVAEYVANNGPVQYNKSVINNTKQPIRI